MEQTQVELGQTQAELQKTKTLFEGTKTELERLKAQLAETTLELEQLERGNVILTETAEQNDFFFYYVSHTKQRYEVYDLEDYLNRWEWAEGAYLAYEFDCSEMSAYLEWKLENEGYHTVIVTGNAPDGDGRHAWLLVETSPDKYMPVEATAYSIVYWENPYFDNYFVYDHRFETIQEAFTYSPTEFDWWKS